MGRHTRTEAILEAAVSVLGEHHPMTVRQLYYQLVSRQVLENRRSQYQALSRLLVSARLEDAIPWRWLEDRTRRPRSVPMWDDLEGFAESVRRAYRRNAGRGSLSTWRCGWRRMPSLASLKRCWKSTG
jgi:hypothetical protein